MPIVSIWRQNLKTTSNAHSKSKTTLVLGIFFISQPNTKFGTERVFGYITQQNNMRIVFNKNHQQSKNFYFKAQTAQKQHKNKTNNYGQNSISKNKTRNHLSMLHITKLKKTTQQAKTCRALNLCLHQESFFSIVSFKTKSWILSVQTQFHNNKLIQKEYSQFIFTSV